MTLIDVVQAFDSFVFDYRVDPLVPALMRMATCLIILSSFLQRLSDTRLFLSRRGVFGDDQYRAEVKRFPQFSVYPILPESLRSPNWMLSIFFGSGLLSLLGVLTPISLVIFLLFAASIQSRTFVIMFSGGDSVSRMLLICLICTDSAAVLSVDSLFRRSVTDSVPGWPIRLLQIYVCCIYFWSAIHKFHCDFWMRGVAVRNAMHSSLWSRGWLLGSVTRPVIYKTLAFATLGFEFFAPFAVWLDDLRVPTVLLGFSLHLGITIFLRIGYFGPLMIVALMSFLA